MVDKSRGGVSLLSVGFVNCGLDDYYQACHTGADGSFHNVRVAVGVARVVWRLFDPLHRGPCVPAEPADPTPPCWHVARAFRPLVTP